MRKILYILIVLVLALPLVAATKPYTVVIDAGHGGKDPGAVGRFSYEKDLNLALALRTGEILKAQYPDVKVVYTRSTDVFIPLQTRADIANKNNADLFISIHANSSETKAACGIETFILGYDRLDKNLDVAMRENAVMKLEADYKTTYHGFDPNSIDSYIMFELLQNTYLDQSLQLATLVQSSFVKNLKRTDRGVQQASFWVLLKTACPSILFEMGFISNPEEERFLNNDSTMTMMATHLVDAFGAYTHRITAVAPQPPVEEPQPAVETPQQERDNNGPKTGEKRELNESTLPPRSANPQRYYAVQICASRTLLAEDDPKLKGQKCEWRKVGEWYKYYTAVDTDRNKVVEAQKTIKKLFPDCWIVTFER